MEYVLFQSMVHMVLPVGLLFHFESLKIIFDSVWSGLYLVRVKFGSVSVQGAIFTDV